MRFTIIAAFLGALALVAGLPVQPIKRAPQIPVVTGSGHGPTADSSPIGLRPIKN